MKAVIICGGAISDYGFIKTQINADDTIICADSGYDHAVKMCLVPDIIVGDFDSIKKAPGDVPCLRYPSHKDLTDTEIAINYARDNNFTDFLLIAAIGSRMDHSLTNILLLKNFAERGETAVIINENNKIMITVNKLFLCEPVGSVISLVPITDCTGVTTENLEYPLNEAVMYAGTGLGISNIMLDDNASVSVRDGLMLVIVAKD